MLPDDLRQRAEAVLLCAVPYVLQLMCWQDSEVLPDDLNVE